MKYRTKIFLVTLIILVSILVLSSVPSLVSLEKIDDHLLGRTCK